MELQNEDGCQTPDGLLADLDFVLPPTTRSPSLMKDLQPDEELSNQRISELIYQFTIKFNERYPSPGPALLIDSLDTALAESLYKERDSKPLILFLYHGASVHTYFFCAKVLCADDIVNYIETNFIVWAWDRTYDTNYQRLLQMIQTNFDKEITRTINSFSIDNFPMLICLSYDNGCVEITKIIQGNISHDDTLELLKEARDQFDRRIETPHIIVPSEPLVKNEIWSAVSSILKRVENLSVEFENIADTYARQKEHIVEINKIENSSWSSQYDNRKTAISKRQSNDLIEEILVYPCSQVCAEHILQYGFNNDHKVRTFSHGLHFQSPHTYQRNYSTNDHLNALLVCHVLVGQTCHKDKITTDPHSYNSITDGSGTYVVNGNEHILPIYYIKY